MWDESPVPEPEERSVRPAGPSEGLQFERYTILVGTEQITQTIRLILPELIALGVTELRLFGSHVRGDATQESDVDLLLTMKHADYGSYCRIIERLEEALGKRVDLVMVEALKPTYRDQVLKEAVRVA